MPVSGAMFERCADTLWAICHSRYVNRFRIGYTKQPIHQRGAAYRNTGWHHCVALADKLNRFDALDLEERLFRRLSDDKRNVIYRKFDSTIRTGPYRRSAGGVSDGHEYDLIHCVYVAWADLPVGWEWPEK